MSFFLRNYIDLIDQQKNIFDYLIDNLKTILVNKMINKRYIYRRVCNFDTLRG